MNENKNQALVPTSSEVHLDLPRRVRTRTVIAFAASVVGSIVLRKLVELGTEELYWRVRRPRNPEPQRVEPTLVSRGYVLIVRVVRVTRFIRG
jgi:hypothetical protein